MMSRFKLVRRLFGLGFQLVCKIIALVAWQSANVLSNSLLVLGSHDIITIDRLICQLQSMPHF